MRGLGFILQPNLRSTFILYLIPPTYLIRAVSLISYQLPVGVFSEQWGKRRSQLIAICFDTFKTDSDPLKRRDC